MHWDMAGPGHTCFPFTALPIFDPENKNRVNSCHLLTSLINWFNVKRVYQIELFKKYPVEVQQETFLKLIVKRCRHRMGEKVWLCLHVIR